MRSWPRTATAKDVTATMKACICNGVGFIRVDVPTSHPLFGEAIPCMCLENEWARERAEKLTRMSGLSVVAMQERTFDKFDVRACAIPEGKAKEQVWLELANVKRKCVEFAKEPKGCLVLVGEVGTGKTHLASAMAGHQLRHDRGVFIGTAPNTLDMLRSGIKTGNLDEMLAWLKETEVVIIDDLGSQYDTDWAKEKLFQIIDHRCVNKLPLVVTCNEHPGLDAEMDRRLGSRLVQGAKTDDGWSRVLTLPCGDYRRRS